MPLNKFYLNILTFALALKETSVKLRLRSDTAAETSTVAGSSPTTVAGRVYRVRSTNWENFHEEGTEYSWGPDVRWLQLAPGVYSSRAFATCRKISLTAPLARRGQRTPKARDMRPRH